MQVQHLVWTRRMMSDKNAKDNNNNNNKINAAIAVIYVHLTVVVESMNASISMMIHSTVCLFIQRLHIVCVFMESRSIRSRLFRLKSVRLFVWFMHSGQIVIFLSVDVNLMRKYKLRFAVSVFSLSLSSSTQSTYVYINL